MNKVYNIAVVNGDGVGHEIVPAAMNMDSCVFESIKIMLYRLLTLALPVFLLLACSSKKPMFFEEKNGILAVEAEDFHAQELDEVRKWNRMDKDNSPTILPDADEPHISNVSGGAYLEILPDTRTNHDEKLIVGENFSNQPGKLGVLHYRVKINNPGKYYVWVRAFSTGTEDNGIHVGLDGKWVESGQRMQWCDGKNQWTWASKQRTKEEHCGIEKQIYLQIDQAGFHTISFSMREDGFEFDKWIIEKTYQQPVALGKKERNIPYHHEDKNFRKPFIKAHKLAGQLQLGRINCRFYFI